MKREEIREMTMQVVYQMDVMGDFDYRNISLITENEQIQKEKQALPCKAAGLALALLGAVILLDIIPGM